MCGHSHHTSMLRLRAGGRGRGATNNRQRTNANRCVLCACCGATGAGALDDRPGAPEQGSSQSTAPTPNKDTASPTRNADGTGQLDTEPVAKDGKSFLGYLWRWVNRPLEWFMRPFPTTFLAPTFAPSPTPASVPTTGTVRRNSGSYPYPLASFFLSV